MPFDSGRATTERLSILDRIDRELVSVPLVPLEEARFLETHVAYEAHSDQHRRFIDWFENRIGSVAPTDRPYRVLSVGCGSGLLDVPVARHLASRGAQIDYVGINPNKAECAAFERHLAASGPTSAQLELVRVPFEEFTTETRFDLVHFVQSLYYFDDPGGALELARRLVAPEGRLILLHAPLESLNQLSTRFYDGFLGRPTLFAEDVAQTLLTWKASCIRERIEARLDVTPLVEGDKDLSLALSDFIVQVESSLLPPELQSLIRAYLDAITVKEPHAAPYIPHPVDAFDVRLT